MTQPDSSPAWANGPFIDEIQRAPDLVLAIKAEVDRNPAPGRFLVSGSANLLLALRL